MPRRTTMAGQVDLSPADTVIDLGAGYGAFENLPYGDDAFSVVWSQDALLHSGDRAAVMAEAARVCAPGGAIVFTDPMQSDDADRNVLQPVLDRINLSSLGSPSFYRRAAPLDRCRNLRFTPVGNLRNGQTVMDKR